MTRVLTVVGARPQFIKAASVSVALRDAGLFEILVHTGQHYDPDMSARFFEELDLRPPDHNLGVGSGPHGAQTAEMLRRLDPVLQREKPDWVLVYGDTNSTLAGALCAAKLCIPVAHVEAGLRSYNRSMPEEINRIVTDRLSSLLFAPTAGAADILRAEGVADDAIVCAGDVMFDAMRMFTEKANVRSDVLTRLELQGKNYLLATVHRAENTDDHARLSAILHGLNDIAKDTPVILSAHPRTRRALESTNIACSRIAMIGPVGYLDMLQLVAHSRLIATDSGGLQKEAYFHGVGCVTLRDETEWIELVDAGWNEIVPPRSAALVASAIRTALDRALPKDAPAFYGTGHAAQTIAAELTRCARKSTS
jgi:UDP-GlcNAc3NAcA epimerase